MKCTKIILTSRKEVTKSSKNQCSLREDQNTTWFTNGYHGYSYKLSGRIKSQVTSTEPIEPQLTISTLVFPDDMTFNTGSSLERWSKKTPRLISAKRKTYTPRKNMLDDEYDFSCAIKELLEDHKTEKAIDACSVAENESVALDINEYFVSSDVEDLLLTSQRTNDEKCTQNKKSKNRKEDAVKRKRNKFKKTIRFSFSKPPSPETEQVIRVNVTSNVSLEEMSQLENGICSNVLVKNDCSKGHLKIISEQMKDLSSRKFDSNNNERDGDLASDGVEEDFIVKCRQLALTQKNG